MSKKTMKSQEELLKEVLVPIEDQPYKVPGNWVWVKLGGIVDFKGGGTPSKDNNLYWNGDIPWASVKDLKGLFLEHTQDSITDEGLRNSSASVAEPGELLLITRMSPGKSSISKIRTAINQDLKIVKPRLELPPYFLWIYFNLNTKMIEHMSTGSTVKGIQINKLKEMPFPLPPLNEQKRIADKVERLLGKINQAKQLIEEAKATFKLRRAAILDKAFRGELTKKWRGQNETSITKVNSKVELTDAPYALPNSWSWAYLEEVCVKITDGTHHSPKSYTTGDYKYITAKNIKEGRLELENISYISAEIHREIYSRCDVKNRDVLYIKDGATTGIAALNDLSEEFSLLSSVGLLRVKDELMLPEYLMYCLNSPSMKNRMLGQMSGNAIRRLTLTKIKKGVIPVPSLKEQVEIVNIISRLFTIEDQGGALINLEKNIRYIEQSILSLAFRGELGTNDVAESQFYLI